MHVTADVGAYPVFTFIPDLTLFMGIGVYHVKSIDLKVDVRLHQQHVGGRLPRGGAPEAAYYLERFMDIIAGELGLTPEAVRRKNFIPPSAFPYAAPTGQNYDSGEYDRALTKALDIAGHDGAARRAEAAAWSAATACCSASAWPATWRCAGSAPSRAPSCAWSRAAR